MGGGDGCSVITTRAGAAAALACLPDRTAVTLAEASDPLAAGLISQLSVDAANRNSGDGVHDLKRNRVGKPADVM